MGILRNTVLLMAMASFATSCLVENDMAYPHVYAEVLAFGVEGQDAVTIDSENRVVAVEVSETADMAELKVTSFELSDAATCDDLHVGDVIDLTSPKTIVLRTYQQYEWTIVATQPVERHVTCKGQFGDAEISLDDRSVYVRISDEEDIKAIVFQDMKLEREGSVITGYEDAEGNLVTFERFPLTLDCENVRYFHVEYDGETYRWGIQVELVDLSLYFTSVNAWATHVDVSLVYDGTGSPYFRYREAGSSSWTDMNDVNISDMEVSATISGLTPGTEYEIMAVNGDNTSGEQFTTEEAVQLHNMSFDNWYRSEDNSAWMPNLDASYNVWDSANLGSASFGFNPTTPTSEVAVSGDGKQAARLETQYAVIKLAAGNLYTGKFGGLVGISGAFLDWGVEFNSRPLALKGYYKYNPVIIDRAQAPYEAMKGTLDICQIQILLTDWSEPFTVNTVEGTFVNFENDPAIIAYGKFESSDDMSEYDTFNIPLEYRDVTRKPTYIVITICASKYGDYFTGGVGSTLLVDELELVYDGDVTVAANS